MCKNANRKSKKVVSLVENGEKPANLEAIMSLYQICIEYIRKIRYAT